MQSNKKGKDLKIFTKAKISIFLKRILRLPCLLSKKEKFIILILSATILISLIILIYDKFFVKKVILPEHGGTYVEGEVGEIRSFLPILKQTEAEKDVSKLIFSSLIKYNNKRDIIGDLAQKWEISPDGKIYTFSLKEAKWQDGNDLQADDVVFTFSLIQNEQLKSPFLETFRDVEVKKINEKTVSFILKNPLSPFLESLTVRILPHHLLAQIPPSKLLNSHFAKRPIGSGPFKLEKIKNDQKGTSIILKANEYYFGGKPYLNKFIFKVYRNQEDLENAINKKQIMGFVEKNKKNARGFKIILPQYKAVFFNLDSAVLNKNLRKAMAFAVNKEEILKEIGGVEKIDYPILPGFLGYKESEKWNFDLEKAKIILSKNQAPPPELTLLTTPDEENQKVAEILKNQWKALGITINVDIKNNTLFEKAITEHAYDLLLIGVNQKADPDPYPFWHSSQSKNGLNFSAFRNKTADKLIEEARKSLNQNVRQQKYEKFIDIIQSEIPAIFLYQPIYNYQVSDKIKGIEDIRGITKSDRFWNVEKWYLKMKKIKK